MTIASILLDLWGGGGGVEESPGGVGLNNHVGFVAINLMSIYLLRQSRQ